MKHITSASNSVFKDLKSLLTTKGIKKQKSFLLSGEKLISEFLRSPNLQIQAQIRTESLPSLRLPATAHDYVFSSELFKEIDEVGTHSNILVLSLPEFETHAAALPISGSELVIPVGDPLNLGALVRSAVAFEVKKIILTTESCHPFHPRAVKASAGSILKAPILWGESLKNYDTPEAYALDMQGQPVKDLNRKSNFRLVVGEEGPGLGFSKASKVSVPTKGVESLNATVAAALALYEINRA